MQLQLNDDYTVAVPMDDGTISYWELAATFRCGEDTFAALIPDEEEERTLLYYYRPIMENVFEIQEIEDDNVFLAARDTLVELSTSGGEMYLSM